MKVYNYLVFVQCISIPTSYRVGQLLLHTQMMFYFVFFASMLILEHYHDVKSEFDAKVPRILFKHLSRFVN